MDSHRNKRLLPGFQPPVCLSAAHMSLHVYTTPSDNEDGIVTMVALLAFKKYVSKAPSLSVNQLYLFSQFHTWSVLDLGLSARESIHHRRHELIRNGSRGRQSQSASLVIRTGIFSQPTRTGSQRLPNLIEAEPFGIF